jgi:hypothetical protein
VPIRPPAKRRLRLKPSYTTKVHLKRRMISTDWWFLISVVLLIAVVVFAIFQFG